MEGNLFCKWIIVHYCQFLDPKKGVPKHSANMLQRWGTILLNDEMECLPSKKLGHEDCPSRLIPTFSVPLEDTVIVDSRAKEVKNMLWKRTNGDFR